MNTNQVYKVIKCPLKSVLKNYDIIQPIIETTVNEINEFPILRLSIYSIIFIR